VVIPVNTGECACIDFAAQKLNCVEATAFDKKVIDLIRSNKNWKTLVILDRGYGLEKNQPYVVRDHVNLSGGNGLIGDNDPIGERFPRLTDVYITDAIAGTPLTVTAGLKAGVVPEEKDVSAMKRLGVGIDSWSYNMVQCMIIAAHAGRKVLGILLPEDCGLTPEIQTFLKKIGAIG
jgi:purine-nucleoside phosphorylase